MLSNGYSQAPLSYLLLDLCRNASLVLLRSIVGQLTVVLEHMCLPLSDWDPLNEEPLKLSIRPASRLSHAEPRIRKRDQGGTSVHEAHHRTKLCIVIQIWRCEDHHPDCEEECAKSAASDLVPVAANSHLRGDGVRQCADREVVEHDVKVGEDDNEDSDSAAEVSIGILGRA